MNMTLTTSTINDFILGSTTLESYTGKKFETGRNTIIQSIIRSGRNCYIDNDSKFLKKLKEFTTPYLRNGVPAVVKSFIDPETMDISYMFIDTYIENIVVTEVLINNEVLNLFEEED